MEQKDSSEGKHPALPCDHRYRTSKYFLQDQLRCSDAVADFRSVRNVIESTQAFSLRGSFRFQPQTVPVRTQD